MNALIVHKCMPFKFTMVPRACLLLPHTLDEAR